MSACPINKYGATCTRTCNCNRTNTIRCDRIDGSCVCKRGWRGVNCSTDVPECTTFPTICGLNAKCIEGQGFYACSCKNGYIMSSNGRCTGKKVILYVYSFYHDSYLSGISAQIYEFSYVWQEKSKRSNKLKKIKDKYILYLTVPYYNLEITPMSTYPRFYFIFPLQFVFAQIIMSASTASIHK